MFSLWQGGYPIFTLTEEIMVACGLPVAWQEVEGKLSCQERRIKAVQVLSDIMFYFSRFPHRDFGREAYEIMNPYANSLSQVMIQQAQTIAQWEEEATSLRKTWMAVRFIIETHTVAITLHDEQKRENYLEQQLAALQKTYVPKNPFALPVPTP